MSLGSGTITGVYPLQKLRLSAMEGSTLCTVRCEPPPALSNQGLDNFSSANGQKAHNAPSVQRLQIALRLASTDAWLQSQHDAQHVPSNYRTLSDKRQAMKIETSDGACFQFHTHEVQRCDLLLEVARRTRHSNVPVTLPFKLEQLQAWRACTDVRQADVADLMPTIEVRAMHSTCNFCGAASATHCSA